MSKSVPRRSLYRSYFYTPPTQVDEYRGHAKLRTDKRRIDASAMTDTPRTSKDADWLNLPSVGREFGSPDHDRLVALDDAAYACFKSWKKVRLWLATPCPQLGGLSPEVAANSPHGMAKVLTLLNTQKAAD